MVWKNFPIPHQLRVEFLRGDLSTGADILSRWYDHENLLTRVNVVCPNYRDLKKLHAEGHWGVEKMEWVCKQKGWTVSKEELKQLNKECEICPKLDTPKCQEKFFEICKAEFPGQGVSMDVVGPLHVVVKGQRDIICLIDHLSRWGK